MSTRADSHVVIGGSYLTSITAVCFDTARLQVVARITGEAYTNLGGCGHQGIRRGHGDTKDLRERSAAPRLAFIAADELLPWELRRPGAGAGSDVGRASRDGIG